MPDSGSLTSSTRWTNASGLSQADLSQAERMAQLSPTERAKLIRKLSTKQIEGLRWDWSYWGRPSQLAPEDPDWIYWLMMAGRGSGKTRAGAEWVRKQKETC